MQRHARAQSDLHERPQRDVCTRGRWSYAARGDTFRILHARELRQPGSDDASRRMGRERDKSLNPCRSLSGLYRTDQLQSAIIIYCAHISNEDSFSCLRFDELTVSSQDHARRGTLQSTVSVVSCTFCNSDPVLQSMPDGSSPDAEFMDIEVPFIKPVRLSSSMIHLHRC